MKKQCILGVVVCSLLVGGLANAATIFTNRTAWEAAVTGALVTDTFSNTIDPGTFMMLLDSGIVSEQTGTASIAIGQPHQAIFSGAFNGFVNQDGPTGSELVWTMPGSTMNAFGGDFFDLNIPDGLTVTGNFDGGGEQVISAAQALNQSDGFFGIIGDAQFSEFVWRSNDGSGSGSGEAFDLDNFSFNPTPVPIPSALYLFGSGLLGLIGISKRKKFNI